MFVYALESVDFPAIHSAPQVVEIIAGLYIRETFRDAECGILMLGKFFGIHLGII